MTDVALKIDRLAAIKKQQDALKKEKDKLEAEILMACERDLDSTKYKSVTYAGTGAEVKVINAESLKVIYNAHAFLPDIFGKAYSAVVTEKKDFSISTAAARMITGIRKGDYIETTVADVISQISGVTDDQRRQLLKKCKGRNYDNPVKQELPKTRERLFRRLHARLKDNAPFFQVFAPELRDSSYGNGLNRILRSIEWIVGLAYGTLSDPQNVDKTAEEVKAGKQRSYTFVCDMQASLQTALEQYIYAVDKYTTVCNLAPAGGYSVKWNWGDGVLEDADKETQIKLQEVNNGIITKEAYLMWRYSVSEDKARKMMPQDSGYKPFFE